VTQSLNMPLVPAPLSEGATVPGFTGVAVFECTSAQARTVALSIVQPNGTVLGFLLDDRSFDLFCETLAPIVAARGNCDGRDTLTHLPSLDAARVLN
jgi:hypothetical protein